MSSVRTKLKEMRLLELKLLVIEYNRASQIDRSISKNSTKVKSDFRKALLNTCIDLFNQIDDRSIKNDKIRQKIEMLSEKYKISYGQSQKVINVCLKQYMFITQAYKIARELDCPLDSITMKNAGIKNNKMISVSKKDYQKYKNKDNCCDINYIFIMCFGSFICVFYDTSRRK